MLIINATLISWTKPNIFSENYSVLVRDGAIVEIGKSSKLELKYPDEERLDAKGQYLMPGLICAHTHYYGAFSRGMAIPGLPPKDFPEILQKLWWPLDRALDLEDVRDSALVCLINAIKHGTTTLVDHHASPSTISGSLDAIADAVVQSGLRSALCYEVTDRNGHPGALEGIAENLRFIQRLRMQPDQHLAATFGLHASFTVSQETLEKAREACPDDIGFHIHVAEHPVDEEDSINKYGLRVVERLFRHKILGPKTIVVHGVHINDAEIELLAATNTWVTHQPRSNMNNAVGLPAIDAMLKAGVRVGMGNDGFSNAMWEEWKAAYLSHKLYWRDPRAMSADAILEMAVYNNARLAQELFSLQSLGMIEVGAPADLILVDYQPFTPVTVGNLPWHIIFGFHESMVTMTMVNGRILMQNRELLYLDEEKISREISKRMPQIWDRYSRGA